MLLAAAATGATLGGRADEFTAAAAALDGNSNALTGNIAGIFGDDAGKAFDPLWKKHIGDLRRLHPGPRHEDTGPSRTRPSTT